jgi:hypothetical protein
MAHKNEYGWMYTDPIYASKDQEYAKRPRTEMVTNLSPDDEGNFDSIVRGKPINQVPIPLQGRVRNLAGNLRPGCFGDYNSARASSRGDRCFLCDNERECIKESACRYQPPRSSNKSNIQLPKSNETNNINEKKESNTMMNNLFKEFYPSEVPSGEVALTMNGAIAVRRKDGNYVLYNQSNGQIENQMNLVLTNSSLEKMYILMPTPLASINPGDIIKEKETYFQIIETRPTSIKVVNLSTGADSNLKIETNIFTGQKLYRKVFSMFSMTQANGGNQAFNPMMFMLMDKDGDGGSSNDMMKLMMMSSMMGAQGAQMGGMNPMMMAMMMGNDKGDSDDMMKLMMMSSMMNPQAGANPFGFLTQPIVTAVQQQQPTKEASPSPLAPYGYSETADDQVGDCANTNKSEESK